MQLSKDIRDAIEKSEIVRQLLEDHVIVLDNSTFTNWNGCFVKGLFAGALKRSTIHGQAPLVFGGAVHEGLEHFHKGLSMDDAMVKALEFANPTDPDFNGTRLDECACEKRNRERLRELLIMYNLDYDMRMDKFHILKDDDGSPMVEKSFRIPLGTFQMYLNDKIETITIMWEGKIDLIDIDESGDLWIVDHKTTSIMGKQFADDLMRSSQMLGYVWAVSQLTEQLGRTVRGVKINAIALRKNGFDFARFPINIADWAVKEWHIETIHACQDICEKLVSFMTEDHVVPSRGSCVTKYGKCPFFDCCQTSPTVRSQFLFDDDYYYTSDWSPLK